MALKTLYSNAGPGELVWVLYPTAVLVHAFAGMEFLFDSQKGYTAIGAPIVIGPGCAGLNFYVIALCMIIFSFISRFARHHLYWFIFFVLMTYGVMVVVNAFRIMGGIVMTGYRHEDGLRCIRYAACRPGNALLFRFPGDLLRCCAVRF